MLLKENKYPSVSICITSYNSEKYISRAINSAINQSIKIDEIIIVDDNSSDKSYELIKQFAKKYNFINCFKNDKNCGVGYSRNRLLNLSKSDYVVFFDDDDYSDPKRVFYQIERILDYKRKYGENIKVLCYTSRQLIYENKKKLMQHPMGTNEKIINPSGVTVAESILFGSIKKDLNGSCPTSSLMAKKKDLDQINNFDENFRRLEDTDLNIRAALNDFHFLGIKKPLVTQYLYKKNYKTYEIEVFYFKKMYEKYVNILYKKDDIRLSFEQKIITIKDIMFHGKYLNFLLLIITLIFQHPLLSCKRVLRSYSNFINLIQNSLTKNY